MEVLISIAAFAAIAIVLYAIALLAIRHSDARYDARSGNPRRKDFG